MDDSEKRANIMQVLEGGPAERAGAKGNDVIEKIDGIDTKGMKLVEVVDRLRGDEGTDVTIVVRQPSEKQSRTLKMTRSALPRTTARGWRKKKSGGWDVRLDGPDAVGYVRITDITASTPHELRSLARQLENEGARAVVLDLRELTLTTDSIHSTVMLADILLDHGPIGRIRTPERELAYEADSDAVFRGWPMAVLIDAAVSGTAEWLVAALQDNRRAILVGSATQGATGAPSALVRSHVTAGDGKWSINMVTGYLEHADGRPLSGISFNPPKVGPGEFPRFMRMRGNATEGVKSVSPTSAKGVWADHPVSARGVSPDISNDATFRKAVEVLRQLPKKA